MQIQGHALLLTVSMVVRKLRGRSVASAHLQVCNWAKMRGHVKVSRHIHTLITYSH